MHKERDSSSSYVSRWDKNLRFQLGLFERELVKCTFLS